MSDTDFTDTQITMSLLIPPTWNLLLNGISPLCPPLKYTKYISSHFLIIINSSSVSLLSPFTFVTTFIMGFKQFTWFWKYWQHININGINLTQVQINPVHVLIFDIYLNFMRGHQLQAEWITIYISLHTFYFKKIAPHSKLYWLKYMHAYVLECWLYWTPKHQLGRVSLSYKVPQDWTKKAGKSYINYKKYCRCRIFSFND